VNLCATHEFQLTTRAGDKMEGVEHNLAEGETGSYPRKTLVKAAVPKGGFCWVAFDDDDKLIGTLVPTIHVDIAKQAADAVIERIKKQFMDLSQPRSSHTPRGMNIFLFAPDDADWKDTESFQYMPFWQVVEKAFDNFKKSHESHTNSPDYVLTGFAKYDLKTEKAVVVESRKYNELFSDGRTAPWTPSLRNGELRSRQQWEDNTFGLHAAGT